MGEAGASRIDFYIALNYRNLKEYDRAIDIINTIVKNDPNKEDAWQLLSFIYDEKGDSEKSDQVIKHLIETHPNSAEYYLFKAERLQQRKKYEESITALKEAALKFPQNDQIYFLFGSAFERLKRYQPAEEHFRKAISLNPRNANALNYLGYMLIDRGEQLEEAVGYVKKALEIDGNNGAYLDSLGWGYFKLDNLDLAEDNLRMALERMRDNAVVHDHMGDLCFKQGKFRDAIHHWELAIENKDEEVDPEYIRKKIEDTRTRLQ